MPKKRSVIARVALFFLLLCAISFAHSASAQAIHNEIELEVSPFGPVVIALLNVETFLGPVADHAIVVDASDTIIAASPIIYNIRLHCSNNTLASCSAYDAGESILYRPALDKAALAVSFKTLATYMYRSDFEGGFTAQQLGPLAQVKQAALHALRVPKQAFLAAFWWIGVWWVLHALILVPLRKIVSKSRPENLFAQIVKAILGLILFAALAFATLLSIALLTPSLVGTLAFAVFGVMLYLILHISLLSKLKVASVA